MSTIADRVFAEVCLDERVSDGIFRLDEEEHMNALRDYFIKKGITKEAAIYVTNKMVEGKYPDRQAYRAEDGITVTWPSPQHKAKAMAENPGKYVEKDPNPKPAREEPKEKPVPPPEKKETDDDEEGDEKDKEQGSNIFPRSSADKDDLDGDKVSQGDKSQGDKSLAVEPPGGDNKAATPAPNPGTVPPAPRTPERVAAEREVIRQIINTDDTALTTPTDPQMSNFKINSYSMKSDNVANRVDPLSENTKRELSILYKKADTMGLREAVTFLTPYINP